MCLRRRKTQFDLKDLKEAATIEVEGTVKPEERAPHGFEIRLDKIKVLSEPAAPMPLAISKWKLNTSLEANFKTTVRSPFEISGSVQNSVFRKVWYGDFVISYTVRGLQRSIHQRSVQKVQRAGQTCSGWNIFTDRQFYSRVLSFTNR